MGIWQLPEGYSELKRINLQTDKMLALLVNVAALVIMIFLLIVGSLAVPVSTLFETSGSRFLPTGRLLGLALAIILYLILHELVHGVFFKRFSGGKVKYGFTGLYAYAGSDAFYSKRQYLIIGLAPVVILGLVLLLLTLLLPQEWFWWVYLIQALNLSGAAGDFYITVLMTRLPPDILVQDAGVAMTIYSRAG